MNKLWVDDLRHPPEGWIWATSITSAIRLLATVEIEEVSLDHDNGNVFSDDSSYEPVARYIAIMNPKPKVSVHSGNPIGRKRLLEILNMKENEVNETKRTKD